MSELEKPGHFLAIRALGRPNRVEIDQSRFEEIQTAWDNLRNVVHLEEQWDAVIQNYLDLETGLLDAAAKHMLLSMHDYHSFQDIRLGFAVKLANLLSTCKAYLDHTPHHLNGLKPQSGHASAFKKATNHEYDNRFGYQFMEALRGYAQHRGLPLHGATYGARRKEGEDEGMFQFSVATHVMVDRLKGDKKFKQSVLNGVTEEKLPAEPLVREYIEGLNAVHVELRKLLEEPSKSWMKTIRGAIAEYVNSSRDKKTLGLCAVEMGKNNEWIQYVPLIEDMLERIEILQKRNRPLRSLARSFVSSASR